MVGSDMLSRYVLKGAVVEHDNDNPVWGSQKMLGHKGRNVLREQLINKLA
jgi:hypothetical protein